MSAVRTASDVIREEVGSWPGVTVDDGEIGELSFRFERRELGHLHGDGVAHFGFPKSVWRELYAAGRIEHHPVFPDREGPAGRPIRDDRDVDDVIALFRLVYDRASSASSSRGVSRP